MKRAQLITVIALTILLEVFVLLFHYDLVSLSQRAFHRVSFIYVGWSFIAGSPFLLMAAVAFIPVLYFMVRWISKIRNIPQLFLFLGILLSSGIAFWILRLKYLVKMTDDFLLKEGVHQSINVNQLKFEEYFCLGMVVGTIISLVVLKLMNMNKDEEGSNESEETVLDENVLE